MKVTFCKTHLNIIHSMKELQTNTSDIRPELRKREGFTGQKMIVMPKRVTAHIAKTPFISALLITDIGYYPKARFHYRERETGIDQYILIYCVEGKGWYEFNGQRFEVNPDDFFILPAGHPHSYGADTKEPWTIYWVHFSGVMADSLNSKLLPFTQPVHYPVFHIDDRLQIFNEMYSALERGYSFDNIGYANSCLWQFLGSFLYPDAYKHNKLEETHDPVEKSIIWMQQHLHESITLEDLAREAKYSVSYYSMLFQKKTGYSPIDYMIHLKMQKACQFLDMTDLKIKEIAGEIGYNDPYYFSRLFHKIMGVYPMEYRKKEKG